MTSPPSLPAAFLLGLSCSLALARHAAAADPDRLVIGKDITVLPAAAAETSSGIRFEPGPRPVLGGWTDVGDTVTWHVDVAAAGAYEVSLTYACADRRGGAELEVRAGAAAVTGKVFTTGGSADFIAVPLGLLALPAGPVDLVVRATQKSEDAQTVMALGELTLEAGFTSLFDGKSLAGWQLVGGEGRGYLVEDGLLLCPADGGGNLFTTRQFADFSFRFEFRLFDGSNNGVGIRAPLEGDAAYVGMEIQILDNESERYRDVLKPWQYHGSIYGVVPAPRGKLRPTGVWNCEEIVARGSRIQVNLNGQRLIDADLDQVRDAEVLAKHPGLARAAGHIGFLGHRSRVELRNIRVKDLRANRDEQR